MIGGLELVEFMATKAENKTLKRQLDEALYALRKLTGADWTQVIETRALPFVRRKVCEACKGLGEISVDKWALAAGVEPQRCEPCNGSGDIYFGVESTTP